MFLAGNEGHIYPGLKGRALFLNVVFSPHGICKSANLLFSFSRPKRKEKRPIFPSNHTMTDSKQHPQVIFCNDSPKRVLVSVIKTTPIKPRKAESLTPTSPGFSDFMVYPWKWGENAHNVSLSPGSASGAASPTGTQTASEADTASSPDQMKVGLLFLKSC